MISAPAKTMDNKVLIVGFIVLSSASNMSRTKSNSAISCLVTVVISVKNVEKDMKKKADRNASFFVTSFW